jgi:2,7-dihydroxy-5-methyl-1-naphthoate 7-O-methyltransferase
VTAISARDRLAAMTDVITPWAIRAAVTLDLPDLIGADPVSADQLAQATKTDADALRRLLRYLSCRGFFHGAPEGSFTASDLSLMLRRDHPSGQRAWLDLDGMGGRNDRTAPFVIDAVRTGAPVYPAVYGRGYWEDLAADDQLSSSFDALMAGHGNWFGLVVAAVDWSRSRHVIDVGGGPGVLLGQVLQAAPELTGAVFDLPGPVAAARATFSELGLAGRAEVLEGSFLDGVPGGGDTYLLSNVLHDWPDAVAEQVLASCAAAAGPGGRVIIAERLVGSDEDPRVVTRMDLRMLLLVGGRERTAADFGRLARRAGLTVTGTRETPAGISVLECAPAAG